MSMLMNTTSANSTLLPETAGFAMELYLTTLYIGHVCFILFNNRRDYTVSSSTILLTTIVSCILGVTFSLLSSESTDKQSQQLLQRQISDGKQLILPIVISSTLMHFQTYLLRYSYMLKCVTFVLITTIPIACVLSLIFSSVPNPSDSIPFSSLTAIFYLSYICADPIALNYPAVYTGRNGEISMFMMIVFVLNVCFSEAVQPIVNDQSSTIAQSIIIAMVTSYSIGVLAGDQCLFLLHAVSQVSIEADCMSYLLLIFISHAFCFSSTVLPSSITIAAFAIHMNRHSNRFSLNSLLSVTLVLRVAVLASISLACSTSGELLGFVVVRNSTVLLFDILLLCLLFVSATLLRLCAIQVFQCVFCTCQQTLFDNAERAIFTFGNPGGFAPMILGISLCLELGHELLAAHVVIITIIRSFVCGYILNIIVKLFNDSTDTDANNDYEAGLTLDSEVYAELSTLRDDPLQADVRWECLQAGSQSVEQRLLNTRKKSSRLLNSGHSEHKHTSFSERAVSLLIGLPSPSTSALSSGNTSTERWNSKLVNEDLRKLILRAQVINYHRQRASGYLSTWATQVLEVITLRSVRTMQMCVSIDFIWTSPKLTVIRMFQAVLLKIGNNSKRRKFACYSEGENIQERGRMLFFLKRLIVSFTAKSLEKFCIAVLLVIFVAFAISGQTTGLHSHRLQWLCFTFAIANFTLKERNFSKFGILYLSLCLTSMATLLLSTASSGLGGSSLLIVPNTVFDYVLITLQICQAILSLIILIMDICTYLKRLGQILLTLCQEKIHNCHRNRFEVLCGLLNAQEESIHYLLHQLSITTQNDTNPIDIPLAFPSQIDYLIQQHKRNRLSIMREIGLFSMAHPFAMTAIKTRKTIELLGINLQRFVDSSIQLGEIDEQFHRKVTQAVNKWLKRRLQRVSALLQQPNVWDKIYTISWIRAGGFQAQVILNSEGVAKKFCQGTILCEQDKVDENGIYIVLSGIVRVSVTINAKVVFEDFFSAGSFLGEISALTGEPRSAKVTTDTVCEVFIITVQTLERAFVKCPALRTELIRCYCVRKLFSDILIHQPRFQGQTEASLHFLLSSCSVVDLRSKPDMTYNIRPHDDMVVLCRGSAIIAHHSRSAAMASSLKAQVVPHWCTAIRAAVSTDDNVWLLVVPRQEEVIVPQCFVGTSFTA